MIAWMITEFSLCIWIENKQADVGQNYCDFVLYTGQISIYKGGAAKIFKELDMIIIICWFKRMFMLIENIRNMRLLQCVRESTLVENTN